LRACWVTQAPVGWAVIPAMRTLEVLKVGTLLVMGFAALLPTS
jgi:hypothetical protein